MPFFLLFFLIRFIFFECIYAIMIVSFGIMRDETQNTQNILFSFLFRIKPYCTLSLFSHPLPNSDLNFIS